MSHHNARSLRELAEVVNGNQRINDQHFELQDKAVQAALHAAKEAVIKAENASEKRFDAINEFRDALSDSTNKNLTRVEYEAAHLALVEKMGSLGLAIENKVEKDTAVSQHASLAEKIDVNSRKVERIEAMLSGNSAGTARTQAIFFSVGLALIAVLNIAVAIAVKFVK